MRHEIGDFLMGRGYKKISCLMRKSHVSRENLMSQENISNLIIFGRPPTRKYPVSCLMRKSHVSRENLMSYQFGPPPKRKSPVSCLRRKFHVFSFLGPPKEKIYCLLCPEKISFIKRKSHVLSVLAPLSDSCGVT